MRTRLLATVVLVACGPSNRDNPATDAPSQPDAPPVIPDGPAVDNSRVYAHSGRTLYRMNNLTLKEAEIGPITGLQGNQSLTDLAIDKDDRMVGITLNRLYSIDANTGAATLIKNLDASNLTSLSYVPRTLGDPNSEEILVSVNSFGDVLEIDPMTGTTKVIGNYGMHQGKQVRSSGDLFAVHGLGVYASVEVGDVPGNDFLAKVDPANGWKATPVSNVDTGYDRIFGLGFWSGIIYGFVDQGAGGGGTMIQIDINTGVAIELSTSSVRWFGAGVATNAPIVQ
ncbi:MAG: hypothetical protein KIT31_12730 [Deltaproteobacteria bacterium]|nr:hypothetical protein [Deltaproteobacteria bacterium]